jgi:hypothetical protein
MMLPNGNETFFGLEPCNGMEVIMRPRYANTTLWFSDSSNRPAEDCSIAEAALDLTFGFNGTVETLQQRRIIWTEMEDMQRWLCNEGQCHDRVPTFELGNGDSNLMLDAESIFVEVFCEDCIDIGLQDFKEKVRKNFTDERYFEVDGRSIDPEDL